MQEEDFVYVPLVGVDKISYALKIQENLKKLKINYYIGINNYKSLVIKISTLEAMKLPIDSETGSQCVPIKMLNGEIIEGQETSKALIWEYADFETQQMNFEFIKNSE